MQEECHGPAMREACARPRANGCAVLDVPWKPALGAVAVPSAALSFLPALLDALSLDSVQPEPVTTSVCHQCFGVLIPISATYPSPSWALMSAVSMSQMCFISVGPALSSPSRQ